jgi:hypothetical protein
MDEECAHYFGTARADTAAAKGGIMKTSEDAPVSGLYSSECCGVEMRFSQDDTLWRCPQCRELCIWELPDADLIEVAAEAEVA